MPEYLLEHHHFFFASSQQPLAPQIDALAHRIGRNLGLNYVPFWRGVLWHGYKNGMLHYVAAMLMEGVADVRAGSQKEEISKRVGGLLRKNLPPSKGVVCSR